MSDAFNDWFEEVPVIQTGGEGDFGDWFEEVPVIQTSGEGGPPEPPAATRRRVTVALIS